jgi:hypothetical protein
MCRKINDRLSKLDNFTDQVREYGRNHLKVYSDSMKLADSMDLLYAGLQKICVLNAKDATENADEIKTLARRVHRYSFEDDSQITDPGTSVVYNACGDEKKSEGSDESASYLPRRSTTGPQYLDEPMLKRVIDGDERLPVIFDYSDAKINAAT